MGIRLLLAALLLLPGRVAAGQAANQAWEPAQIESLRAFARLYGDVRFFHPSEAVVAVDWDKLAVHGASRALMSRGPEQLAALLEELFLPLAPTLTLYPSHQTAPDPTADWPPPGELLVVAWQHRGFGFGEVGFFRSARIFRPRDPPLFDAFPEPGEIVDRELGFGLRAVMPLALLSDGVRTFGGRRADPARLDEELGHLDLARMDADNIGIRLGAIVVAWNVLRHFHPYPDDVDWEAALTEALEGALEAADERDFLRALQRLVARLGDGQAGVRHPELDAGRAGLPVAVAEVEERIVVTASGVAGVERGDVVARVDRIAAEEVLRERAELVSGSPRHKIARALEEFAIGPEGTEARLTLRRGDATVEIDVPRREWAGEAPRPAVETLAGGVRYLDLRRVAAARIATLLPDLAAAPGVVFDLRGAATPGSHVLLHHLAGEPVRSASWSVPGVIRPGGEEITYLDLERWRLEPREPRLSGRAVFLADARTVGYGESLLAVVAHHGLGEIVGRATAGAEGTVNTVALPGGFRLSWTGVRVLRHDGSRFHGIGIRPTAPVARTLAAVRAGRDEDLEKALEIAGAGQSR